MKINVDKTHIKLGFWIAVGFLLLALVMRLFSLALGKVTGGLRGDDGR